MEIPNGSDDFRRRNPHLFPKQSAPHASVGAQRIVPYQAAPTGLKFKSHAEKLVYAWLLRQNPLRWGYESITLHITGAKYTPDFWMIEADTGHFVFIEVKGKIEVGGKQKGQLSEAYSRARFRAAAALHNWAKFLWIKVIKQELHIEEFKP